MKAHQKNTGIVRFKEDIQLAIQVAKKESNTGPKNQHLKAAKEKLESNS